MPWEERLVWEHLAQWEPTEMESAPHARSSLWRGTASTVEEGRTWTEELGRCLCDGDEPLVCRGSHFTP